MTDLLHLALQVFQHQTFSARWLKLFHVKVEHSPESCCAWKKVVEPGKKEGSAALLILWHCWKSP